MHDIKLYEKDEENRHKEKETIRNLTLAQRLVLEDVFKRLDIAYVAYDREA